MRLLVLASLIATTLVQQGSAISDLLERAVDSERAYHATFVKLTAQETRIVEIFGNNGNAACGWISIDLKRALLSIQEEYCFKDSRPMVLKNVFVNLANSDLFFRLSKYLMHGFSNRIFGWNAC